VVAIMWSLMHVTARVKRKRAEIAIAGILAVATAMSCDSSDARPGRHLAESIAEAYFAALTSGQPDFGWSLLHPHSYPSWTGYEVYEETVRENLGDLTVDVTTNTYCHDGVVCEVCLHVPGGIDSVPEFMRATDNKGLDGILFVKEPLDCGNAIIGVVVGPLPWDAKGVSLLNH
jgi:hypothetical protein